jgi:hypothetical protein
MRENSDLTSRRYIEEEKLTVRDTARMPDPELSQIAMHVATALQAID